MNSQNNAEISDLTNTLRESLNLQVPIDVRGAVERLGGELIEGSALDVSVEALVRRKMDSFQIVLHDNKPDRRKRFSIAHEMGHLFLHMGYLINPELWGTMDEYKDSVYYRYGHGVEEDEANEFAACLLMPESEFRAALSKCTEDPNTVLETLSERFDVSKEAVSIRARNLGLLPR